ncbi:MAG: efflux RND transporter permease subunit [Puniceicoccales bacterium]|jgi:HAE1 family hydrophobic/amphiphilic exporter-1|nr:efflux RND transporter permease subunit [Puniceicoccales bacterium]
MKSLSEIFIKRPVMTMLLVISVILAGVFSYWELPVSDLPVVDYPVINVRAGYPGMDPQMVAANIASPLEKEFMQISGIDQVTSTSMQGMASITLQFNLNKSIDSAANDVQAAITRASSQLPHDMPAQPVYEKTDPNSIPIFFLNLSSDTLSQAELYELADREIINKISILDGVSKVQVYGIKRAIRIELDTDKLYNKGITISNVADAVRLGTVSMAAGSLKGKKNSVVLKPMGQLETAQGYSDLIIAYKNGAPIYLRDVGEAIEGVESNDVRMCYWNRDMPPGRTSVAIAVTRGAGANAVKISEAIGKLIPQINRQLPSSVTLTPVHDRAHKIANSIDDVKETLVIAFLLVVAVIFLFLGRLRETFIPVVALPLSLLITFVVMRLLNYSLDNLSLLALTLAIGFLVDDAIVFLENMVRRMEKLGETPLQASIEGGKEITFTILSMTLSLAAVFIPMIFMPGQLGRVFREFSITIVVAILASGVVSITVTPMMCARLLKPIAHESRTTLERLANFLEAQFLRFYGVTLRWFLDKRWTAIFIWLLCTVLTYLCFLKLPKTFLPEGDSGMMMGVFIGKEGTSPKQMHAYQDQVQATLASDENVRQAMLVTGISGFMQENQGLVIVFLKEDRGKTTIQEIARNLTKKLFMIPGAMTFLQPIPNLQINTGTQKTNQGKYCFSLTSNNFQDLVEPAQKLQLAMMTHPGFASVSTDLYLQNPELEIEFLREQASLYGVNVTAIENEIKNAFSENYAYLIKGDINQYKVIVTTKGDAKNSPDDLKDLYVRTRSGDLTPLQSVASVKQHLGPVSVCHINNMNSVTLYFNLHPGYAIGDATKFISQKAQELLPPSVTGVFQGEAATFAETMRIIMILLFVAIFVMYTILGILYESYIHPITVLSSLTVAMLGGLATLLLAKDVFHFNGMELSLYACIGLFMLLGIVKKNGIMIVDFAIARRREGKSPEDAIHEASMARFRPIIMTTLAALMGMIPIAAGWGADGASRIPLGLCVVGGLVFSQIVTLYLTPVIYVCMEYFQERILDRIPFFAREIE